MDGILSAPAEETPRLVLVTGLPGTGKSTVAEAIAQRLGACVLAHDWAMSGLRPYGELQAVLDVMEPSGHRVVGWSILNALARLQLRHGRSVVLDGVARTTEIEDCKVTAESEGADFALVATRCSDLELHHSQVEGRQRLIPNWYELDWPNVEAAISRWVQPDGVDLSLDSAAEWEFNTQLIDVVLGIERDT